MSEKEPKAESSKVDLNVLANADTTWIESVVLDADDNTAVITLNVPLGGGAGVVEYEELVEYGEAVTPDYLHEATRVFAEAAIRYIKERGATKIPEGKEVLCTTCTSPCCARVFSEITVSPAMASC